MKGLLHLSSDILHALNHQKGKCYSKAPENTRIILKYVIPIRAQAVIDRDTDNFRGLKRENKQSNSKIQHISDSCVQHPDDLGDFFFLWQGLLAMSLSI